MSLIPSILVIDDEPQIQRFLKPSLTAAGYHVAQALTAAAALKAIVEREHDLILVDLGLPDLDGKDLIRTIRQKHATAIIVLSAREEETEKIEALDAGADDFVNKPFSIGELLARMRAAMRRGHIEPLKQTKFEFGDIAIDTIRHEVAKAGSPIHLTPKEFDLLVILARHSGRVVTHRHILKTVWGPAHVEDTQYLRVFIGQLRQKIETTPDAPTLIQTEPGVGYRIAEFSRLQQN
jgi:two-component system, OmpR family, KDP operon response regulator KdpE